VENQLVIEGMLLSRKTVTNQPISLTLKKGEGIGIYGPNGSGKSTLLDSISGILPLAEGRVTVNGILSYAMQFDGFQENLSCLDNLYLEANYAGIPKNERKERITKRAQECGVTSFLKKKVNKLSSGMRVRLMLAASLLVNPDVLLLDEAFNALDEETIVSMQAILHREKQNGLSILFVSHNKFHFESICESILLFPSLEVEAL
jgi:ABC-type multidrug transport system ATPase subunit